jgi:transposase-like protein
VGDARPCPNCGSTDRRKNGYQNAPKTVARLVTREGIEDVGVQVQQYECKECGRSFQGDLSELFYEGCDYARPVVDLCLFHARQDSPSACERSLRRMYGLQVNRDTVERYTDRFDAEVMEFHPVDIAGHTYSLGFLSFLFGDDDTDPPQFVLRDKTAFW